MKPTPQCPHARHPIAFAIQVPAQTADPQHRLADRQFRWLHPFPKATYQHLDLVFAQDLQPGASGVSAISQQHDPPPPPHRPSAAFSSLSQVSKRSSSTTALSTKWTSSIPTVYFRTISSTSSPDHFPHLHQVPVIGQTCGYFWRSGTNVTRIDRTSTAARRSGTLAFRLTSTMARHRTGWLPTSCSLASGSSILRSSGHSG